MEIKREEVREIETHMHAEGGGGGSEEEREWGRRERVGGCGGEGRLG